MKKVQIQVLILTLLSILFSNIALSQPYSKVERKKIAEQAIEDLKGGTLILRLKSKHNKISKLKELLANPNLKDATKDRLNNNLKTTIDEKDRFNSSLIEAFETYYNFSNVFYMYDTASVDLKDGQRSGIFLNKNLELDPSIKIPSGKFFVIKIGTTDSSTTTGVEALVLMDEKFMDLAPPFPYYVRINSISRLFTRIFNHRNLVRKDSTAIVQKLERKLNRYAELVNF